MKYKKISELRFLLILLSLTLFSCHALSSPSEDQDLLPPEAMAKAKAFFEAVENENFITAYPYVSA